MLTAALARVSGTDSPRTHETVQLYFCWRCRRKTYVRRTFTIDFVDGRPRRTYEIAFFTGSPRCLVCGEELELRQSFDAEAAEQYCARRCMRAPHRKDQPCQCHTCFGAAHGTLVDEDD